MELRIISANVHDVFASNHSKNHFMQDSTWGHFKALGEWEDVYIGLYDDQSLVASSLLLKRKVPTLYKRYIYYAPRGFIIDFNDIELLSVWTKQLKIFLKKQRAVYLIVDPDIIYQKFDNNHQLIEGPYDKRMQMMQAMGYTHQGFNLNFENTQPRFTFRMDLTKPVDAIEKQYARPMKRSLQDAKEAEIEVFQSDDIDAFYELMHMTALRDGFVASKKTYYQQVYNQLTNQHCKLYLAKYTPSKHHIKVQLKYDDLLNKYNEMTKRTNQNINKVNEIKIQLEKVTKQLDEIKELIDQYPSGIIVSGIISAHSSNKAWTLYGGNHELARKTGANQLVYDTIIKDYKESGKQVIDFFGVTGDYENKDNPLYGLYAFKRQFGSDLFEFIGEFHLITNSVAYAWTNKVLFKVRDYLINRQIKK